MGSSAEHQNDNHTIKVETFLFLLDIDRIFVGRMFENELFKVKEGPFVRSFLRRESV